MISNKAICVEYNNRYLHTKKEKQTASRYVNKALWKCVQNSIIYVSQRHYTVLCSELHSIQPSRLTVPIASLVPFPVLNIAGSDPILPAQLCRMHCRPLDWSSVLNLITHVILEFHYWTLREVTRSYSRSLIVEYERESSDCHFTVICRMSWSDHPFTVIGLKNSAELHNNDK